jgi:phosphoesterase RecJ-like protein
MAKVRLQRVAEQLQQEISSLVTKGIKDPRIGMVTITGVEVSPDLQQAMVFFATSGGSDERERSRQGLQSAAGFIRKTLGRRLRLKVVPEFHFKYDESFDRGDRIERLLARLQNEKTAENEVRGSAEDIAEMLKADRRYLLVTHNNPDGDAIASLLGLRLMLEKLGADVVAYATDPVPHNFRFLPGVERMVKEVPAGRFDCTVVLDCSELDRCSPLPPAEVRGVLLSVDHHLVSIPLGDVYYINPRASAIGEMLLEVLDFLPIEADAGIATCLYTSILSDTGSFRYSNTTPRALEAAARLVELGASPWQIAFEVYESQPPERMALLARVLPTLRLEGSGRIASIVITRKMMEESSATLDMVDGLINYPRAVKGVEVAVQYREIEDGKYKVSFRSAGNVDVARIAGEFAGGGHRNAAGCTLEGGIDQVRELINRAALSQMK